MLYAPPHLSERAQARDPLRAWLLVALAAALPLAGARIVDKADEAVRVPPPRTFADQVAGSAATATTAPLPGPPPVLDMDEPTEAAPLDRGAAEAFNASIPISPLPNPAARPLRLAIGADDRARAVDCLAAAEIYEAGDDATGERAVAQVVLNRLRHPAFPRTVCGVVFEGQERRTGCQFTFSCDGALARYRPTPAAWERARAIADRALSGEVYKPVGWSTHYHTNWVVPYWSSSLEKVAVVDTHLFFRWQGWWGTPPAFRFGHTGSEPRVAKLAPLSDAHKPEGTVDEQDAAVEQTPAVDAGRLVPSLRNGTTTIVDLSAAANPDAWPALAQALCDEAASCRVLGWRDARRRPAKFPIDPASLPATFSYLRDRKAGLERTLWNCDEVPRDDAAQCMKARLPIATARPPIRMLPAPVAPAAAAPKRDVAPLTLEGVRRPGRTAPADPPAPAPPARATPAPVPTPRPF